jgi:hypothetical protein
MRDLTTAPVLFPRAAGRPPVQHEELLPVFERLKSQDFPALAQLLHERVGRKDKEMFQRFLVERILIQGSMNQVEHLVRHPDRPWTQEAEEVFQTRLGHRLIGDVSQVLARRVQYHLTAEVGQQLQAVIRQTVAFLGDLLTASPPGRLLIPTPDSPFDPERHELISAEPPTEELKVTAMLFPGYVVRDTQERILARAQVTTE